MKRCEHCNVNYFPKTKHDEHCSSNEAKQDMRSGGSRQTTQTDFMAELKKLQDKVSKMEGEITRLKTMVHKNPVLKDILKDMNTRINFPYMRIFSKWYESFPMPTMEEVDKWFPTTMEQATREKSMLHDYFVEFFVKTWESSLSQQHPPLYCSLKQRKPSYFVFDVEDVSCEWRLMKPSDWTKMLETVCHEVYRKCSEWLFSKSDMPIHLYNYCATQINQELRYSKNLVTDIKREMAEVMTDYIHGV